MPPVVYRSRETAERAHGMFPKFCSVYRSLHTAIAMTTELVFKPT